MSDLLPRGPFPHTVREGPVEECPQGGGPGAGRVGLKSTEYGGNLYLFLKCMRIFFPKFINIHNLFLNFL